jgi:hypothetical protein
MPQKFKDSLWLLAGVSFLLWNGWLCWFFATTGLTELRQGNLLNSFALNIMGVWGLGVVLHGVAAGQRIYEQTV